MRLLTILGILFMYVAVLGFAPSGYAAELPPCENCDRCSKPGCGRRD